MLLCFYMLQVLQKLSSKICFSTAEMKYVTWSNTVFKTCAAYES